MPILSNLLISLFGWLGGFFVKYLGQKAAFWVICVTTIFAAYGVLRLAVAAIVSGLVSSAPDMVETALTWFVPPQFQMIVAARLAAQVAIAMYGFQLNLRVAMMSGA